MTSDSFTREKFDWLDRIAGDPRLPATASRLAIVLTRYLNRQSGEAWPSVARLADDLSTAENTVRAALKALKKCGHLTVEIGGGNASNRYRMIIDPCNKLKVSPLQNSEGVENCTPSGNCTPPLQVSELDPCKFLKTNPKKEPKEEPIESKLALSTPKSSRRREDLLLAEQADRFYSAYPKKVNPADARKKFATIVRSGVDPERIISAAERFAGAHRLAGTDKQFIPAPAVWLNKGGFDSEDLPMAATNARAGPARGGPATMLLELNRQTDDEKISIASQIMV
jgi:hypothetical protein